MRHIINLTPQNRNVAGVFCGGVNFVLCALCEGGKIGGMEANMQDMTAQELKKRLELALDSALEPMHELERRGYTVEIDTHTLG